VVPVRRSSARPDWGDRQRRAERGVQVPATEQQRRVDRGVVAEPAVGDRELEGYPAAMVRPARPGLQHTAGQRVRGEADGDRRDEECLLLHA